METSKEITYFAETDFRNKKTPFGIKAKDRLRHVYIIGKTGMGKSTLLENMAAQDLINGNGMCFIDPHGMAIDTLLGYVPENRIDDVIHFSPADTNFPIAFNVMEDVGPEKRHLVAQGLLSAFKKIWGADTFSDRMEHIVNNTLLALLEYPESTMLSIPRIFIDNDFQKDVIKHITDPSVLNFWTKEYASWDDRYRKEAYSAVLNKVGQFTSNPIIRNIVGQPKSTFDFRKIMDEKKILLVNLSIGQIGEANANLLGSMMTTKVYLSAMSRADLTQDELSRLPEFYLYIDEFQNLANDSFADILSQARKYKLALTMAHQYIEQMPETVRSAVFGNVGTMIVFRIGSFDAEIFEKEFSPTFFADDLVNLGFAQIYLRLMIDGVGSQPFSARTLPPIKPQEVSFREDVVEASRKNYGKSKDEVETMIKEWNDKSFKQPKQAGSADEPRSASAKKNNFTKRNDTPARFPVREQKNSFRDKAVVDEKPALEGAPSLKDALESAMKTKPIGKYGSIEKNRIDKMQNEVVSENRNKLKEALSGVITEQNNQKSEAEERSVDEIPEDVLKEMLE